MSGTSVASEPTAPPAFDYLAVTADLCDLFRDRAFIRAEQVRVRCGTLNRALEQGSNITTARERADAAVAELESQALKTEGEIAVCQAKLRYLDHLFALQLGRL